MILFLVFSGLHILFYSLLGYRWKKILSEDKNSVALTFSIILPVRNEEKCIEHILNDLQNQDFPKNRFEIIVVDDFSEDRTPDLVRSFLKKSSHLIHLLQLSNKRETGKKYALTRGIEKANHDIILTTDADCRIGSQWIHSFEKKITSDTQIVAGPVALHGDGWFAKLQQLEFAGMMGFGAATIAVNNPSMCSGANLGFRKSAFLEINGYEGNIFLPSGDDEFLLYDIVKKYPNSASFLKSKHAIVRTDTHKSFRSFLNQRIRWTGKWKHNKNHKLRATAILFFLDYLLLLIVLSLCFVGHVPIRIIGMALFLRLLSNYFFLEPLYTFIGGGNLFFPLLSLQILYPIHVLFMGMRSIFGTYTWKGRKYHG